MLAIRAPILNPRGDGTVQFIADGALIGSDGGLIEFIGEWREIAPQLDPVSHPPRLMNRIILPPFLDNHIHIPQHPIRGRFMEGVEANPHGGRLLAGLNRNVFPAEQRCHAEEVAEQVVREFLDDTLSQGVVGGAAYMTVHASATRVALRMLPPT